MNRRASAFGIVLLFLTIGFGCRSPHPEAAYMQQAIDSLMHYSLHERSLDRGSLITAAHAQLRDTSTRAHSHAVLRTLATRIDKHSNLYAPGQVKEYLTPHSDVEERYPFTVRELEEGTAYIRVDGFMHGDEESCRLFADSLQRSVLQLHASGSRCWLIDLRSNTGGNLYPMLAGLGPLLGCGELGWDVEPNGDREAWFYCLAKDEPSGPQHITLVKEAIVLPDTLPLVVLIGERTGSAGEALAMSFIGRPNTWLYGSRTSGFTTGNRMVFLSDSAIFNITNSVMTDRNGSVHVTGILPDRTFQDEDEAFREAMRILTDGAKRR